MRYEFPKYLKSASTRKFKYKISIYKKGNTNLHSIAKCAIEYLVVNETLKLATSHITIYGKLNRKEI